MQRDILGLTGKVALVTGGGAGIGRAIAEAFGELGARLVVAEIDERRAADVRSALDAAGVDNLVVTANVRDDAQVRRVADQVEARHGRLDILVNNVGDTLGISKPFADTTIDEWQGLYEVNLRHVMAVTHMTLPLMRRTGDGGGIINISSIEGLRGHPNGVVYSTFKAGVLNFTRSLACELGGEGIRVNAIASETTETEQVQIVSNIKPEHRSHLKRWFPLGRYGRPQDTAGAAVYLASDLSQWVTGETILVDGGALAQAGWRQTRNGQWTNSPIIDDFHRAYGPVKP
jgi:NAD(P)-dependent dehydrogenase (short-subunit alcohol dehydrogenase family)